MKNILLLSFLVSLISANAQVSNRLDANDDINCENKIYNTRELQQFAYNSHCKAEAYPFLSDDGRDLYFTADHSYHWLFYTQKDSVTQVWSVPMPIQIANYSGPILSSYFSRDLMDLYFTNNSSELFHCKSIEGSRTQFSQPVQINFTNPKDPNNEGNAYSPFSSISFLDGYNKLYAVSSNNISGQSKYVYYLKTAENTYTHQNNLSSFSEELGFMSSDGLRYYFTCDDVPNVLFCRVRTNIKEDFGPDVYSAKKFEAHLKITQCRMAEKANQLVMVLSDEQWDKNDIYFYNVSKEDTLKKFDLNYLVIKDNDAQKANPTPLFISMPKPDKKSLKTVELLNQAGADMCKIDIGVPFPNPAKNQFTLYYNVSGDNLNLPMPILHITDMTGKILYSAKLEYTSGQVLVAPEHLNPGSYYVKIEYHGVFSNSIKITLSFS
jgi:hypothetical protein